MKQWFSRALLCVFILASGTSIAAERAMPSAEQLWEIIQSQQEEIDALKRGQRENSDKAEAAVVAVEDVAEMSVLSDSWTSNSRIGGYGELHYNKLSADDSSRDKTELDFHRFVLFVSHDFNDRIRFFSEVEIEHAISKDTSDGSGPGEVEIEQAYLEFDITDNLLARGGVFLLPVGIMNETHEPTTFYGVERNDVENVIIPATWWAAGAGLSGHADNGFSWDLALHEGLEMPTTGGSAFRVRSGRQKSGKAAANDLAYSGRVRYTGIAGLELAASAVYQSNPSQTEGDGLDSGLLLETHVAYQNGPFGLRALYAQWDFDGVAVEAAGADEQQGWYLEPSYRANEKIGVYARYEDVEGARTRDRFDQWELGFNYWPHEDVVIKFDFRSRDHDLVGDAGRNFDGFDVGLGYQF